MVRKRKHTSKIGLSLPNINIGPQKQYTRTNHSCKFTPRSGWYKNQNIYRKKYKYITIATSYKIKGRRYITLNLSPYCHVSTIKHFYKRFSAIDSFRFNIDLIQALSQQGIMPSLNKNTNLRLFLQAKSR